MLLTPLTWLRPLAGGGFSEMGVRYFPSLGEAVLVLDEAVTEKLLISKYISSLISNIISTYLLWKTSLSRDSVREL